MARDPSSRPGLLARALFSLALRAWPARLRASLGDEMRATFAARVGARRAEGRRVAPLILLEIAGTAAAGLRARVRRRGRSGASLSASRASLMDALLQDLRFAWRSIVQNPGFAAVVALVLALGIGANTAIFSVVNAALLRPLPVHEPDRLVAVRESNPEKGWVAEAAAPANMLDWRENVAAFEDVAAYSGLGPVTLTGQGEPELLRKANVTGNFFPLLGVRAGFGRTFREAETWDTEPPVVLLSDAYWARRFGRDPSVLGRTLTLDGRDFEVVGIMPSGFAFPGSEMDVWLPMRWSPEARTQAFFRRAHWIHPVARLRPGITLGEADAQLQVVVRRLQDEYPATNQAMGAGIHPLHSFLTGSVRTPLLLLQGAVLLLLLVACTNVGNLMLVRAAARRREMAVRSALGAGPARNARLVLTESLLLSVLGAAAGLAVGLLAVQSAGGLLPDSVPPIEGLGLDARVLAFVLGTTLLAGLAFGAMPALRGARTELAETLRAGGRGASAGRRAVRGGHVLVAAEVALALVLVLGAGLLVRSFVELRRVDPGFRIADRVTARVSLPGARYDSPEKRRVFFDRLLEQVEAAPGIRHAGLVRALPLTSFSYTSDFVAEDWAPAEFGAEVTHQVVSASYFETLGIPLLRGRALEETDRADTEPVLLVNQTLARRFFPDEEPVGRRLAFDRAPGENSTWWRIVGVVGDTRQEAIDVAPRIEVYKAYRQEPTGVLHVVLHGSRPSGELIALLRDAVAALDPDIPLADARPFEAAYAASLQQDRLLLVLIAAFGALALLLAAIGVYGVASQAARRRTQEIGIRVALGASRADVARLVLVQALAPVGAGVALGLAGGLAATRAMTSVLYGVAPTDPLTFLAVPLLLAGTALLASWLPARRATRADPLLALRAE